MSTLQARQELVQGLVCVKAQAKAYRQLASTHWQHHDAKAWARTLAEHKARYAHLA